MQSLKYKDQLADARWQQKKYEILQRDNFACQKCGATTNLNVHHLSYEKGKLAWEYPNENLITLCQDCHEKEHDIAPYPKIGKFYTFYHSDYWNDMLCYHIDYQNELVYLFGIDMGSYGSGYIYVFSFTEFFSKCSYSNVFFDKDVEYDDYNVNSFYLAYHDLLNGNAYVIDSMFYSDNDTISFAKIKVKDLLYKNKVIVKLFNNIENNG